MTLNDSGGVEGHATPKRMLGVVNTGEAEPGNSLGRVDFLNRQVRARESTRDAATMEAKSRIAIKLNPAKTYVHLEPSRYRVRLAVTF